MYKLFLPFLLLCAINLNAQSTEELNAIQKEILAEGLFLYELEKAAWISTDLFMEKFKTKNNVGGYVNYHEDDRIKSVYYTSDEEPTVFAEAKFTKSFSNDSIDTSFEERQLSKLEKNLILLREKTIEALIENKDSIFSMYSNTNFNFIPNIYNDIKRVIILTAPLKSGNMIIGNDYEVIFTEDNEIKSAKKIHNNIIAFPFKSEEGSSERCMHTHLESTGPFMTATDICTTLLYKDFADWEYHDVYSKDYTSIFKINYPNLLIMTNSAMDQIYADQEQRANEREANDGELSKKTKKEQKKKLKQLLKEKKKEERRKRKENKD